MSLQRGLTSLCNAARLIVIASWILLFAVIKTGALIPHVCIWIKQLIVLSSLYIAVIIMASADKFYSRNFMFHIIAEVQLPGQHAVDN